jgi:hypothetical protein
MRQYEIGFGDNLAWALVGTGKYEDHEFTVRMTVRRTTDGRTMITQQRLEIPGLELVDPGPLVVLMRNEPNPAQN